MKNFKKTFRLLAAAVVFALFVSTAFADTSYNANSENNSINSIEILNGIGVLDGLDFILSEQSVMTRAEFITLAMHLYTGGKHATSSSVSFSDVPSGASYMWAIGVAYDAGFISGHDNGSFMPNASISYNEAIKIIVSALGYKAKAEAKGGYPSGYLLVASQLDLSSSAPADYSMITGGEAAELVLNALNTNMLDIDEIGSQTVTYKARDNETWLSKSFDILKCEGVVEKNSVTGLYFNSSNLKDNQLEIDGKVYDTKSANYDNCIGMNIVYYLRGDDEIVYAYADSNKLFSVKSDDIIPASDRTFKYYEGGKSKSISLDKGIAVIYNGVSLPDYDMNVFNVKNGRVDFISNKNNGTYNVAKIYDYQATFITALDVFNETVTDAVSKTVIDYGRYDRFSVYDSDGREISVADIPLKSAVSMFTSKDSNVSEWYISDDIAEGFVEEKGKNGEDCYIVVSAQKITLSNQSGLDIDNIDIGKKIIGYTDIDGKIIYADLMGYTETKYAYLISTYASSGLKGQLNFMIYDKDGIIKTLKCTDKLYLNGNKVSNMKNVPAELTNPTAIVYKCNEYGDVSTIYTPDASGSPLVKICDDGEKMFYPGNGNYVFAYENETAYSGSFCVDADTVMLSIPKNAVSANEKYFSVLNPSSFALYATYDVAAYTQNESSNIAEFVISVNKGDSQKLSLNREAVLVKDKFLSLSDNGEETYSLTLIGKNGKNKTYKTVEKTIAESVNEGDIIVYSLNKNSEISNITIALDYEFENEDGTVTKFIRDSKVVYNGKWYSNCSLYRGYVYSNLNGIICFAETGKNPLLITRSDMLSFKTAGLSIIEVDMDAKRTDEKIKYLNADSVSSYKDTGSTEDIWLYVKSGTPIFMVKYK